MPLSTQIDGKTFIPDVRLQMGNRGQCGQHSGIGDQAVQPSPAPLYCGSQTRDRGRVLHVHFDNCRYPTGGLDLVIDLLERTDRSSGYQQLSTGGGGSNGDSLANAATCSSDQNQLASQTLRFICHLLHS